jgi:hypothetical protein
MKTFQLTSNPKVEILMNSYAPKVKERLLNLRRIILEAADELPRDTETRRNFEMG